ncbi:DUF6192 family protein [Streptomyces tauricus]|nr:DUF6192 family protein [Streptomyces tauricus]MCW8103652.1 DUF6192 family protein [Streptomyces tauricus]
MRRGIAKVRGAADWLEAALDTGRFTLDEQLSAYTFTSSASYG